MYTQRAASARQSHASIFYIFVNVFHVPHITLLCMIYIVYIWKRKLPQPKLAVHPFMYRIQIELEERSSFNSARRWWWYCRQAKHHILKLYLNGYSAQCACVRLNIISLYNYILVLRRVYCALADGTRHHIYLCTRVCCIAQD